MNLMKIRLLFVLALASSAAFGQTRIVSNMVSTGDTLDVSAVTDDAWIRLHTIDGSNSTEAIRIKPLIELLSDTVPWSSSFISGGYLYVLNGSDTVDFYVPQANRQEVREVPLVFYTNSASNYTPDSSDVGCVLDMTNAGTDTIQLPTHAALALDSGIVFHIRNYAGGTTLVRHPSGGSISADSIVSADGWGTVVKMSNTEWDLFGKTQ